MSAHPTPIQAAAQLQANTLFASLELSKARWLVTVSVPGSDKLARHDVPGGSGQALLKLLWRLQAAAAQRTGARSSSSRKPVSTAFGSIACWSGTGSPAMLSIRPRSR
jgi:hypothetical protein